MFESKYIYRYPDTSAVINRKSSTAPCNSLGSPLLVFHLIHCPNCAFHIFYTHKALVQAEVVTDCVLIQKKIRVKKILPSACCINQVGHILGSQI